MYADTGGREVTGVLGVYTSGFVPCSLADHSYSEKLRQNKNAVSLT